VPVPIAPAGSGAPGKSPEEKRDGNKPHRRRRRAGRPRRSRGHGGFARGGTRSRGRCCSLGGSGLIDRVFF
jgi:hypothetical protein